MKFTETKLESAKDALNSVIENSQSQVVPGTKTQPTTNHEH